MGRHSRGENQSIVNGGDQSLLSRLTWRKVLYSAPWEHSESENDIFPAPELKLKLFCYFFFGAKEERNFHERDKSGGAFLKGEMSLYLWGPIFCANGNSLHYIYYNYNIIYTALSSIIYLYLYRLVLYFTLLSPKHF